MEFSKQRQYGGLRGHNFLVSSGSSVGPVSSALAYHQWRLLQIGKKKEAIGDCTIAIQLDEFYVKAYLKRAQL